MSNDEKDDLEFGVMMMTFGASDELLSPRAFRRIAEAAEDSGFDWLWAGDHVAFPDHIPDEYPFTETGEARYDITDDIYEVFDTLSYVAGATDSLGLGTNVAIAPYRHPVLLARNALTVNALAEERFELGIGPGWLRTEFDVLGVPFDERGSRTDEFLRMFDQACESGELAFEGPHHSFQETGFHPRPADGNIPVWVGGKSGATFRRVAEFGTGWTIYTEKPPDVRAARERLMTAWRDYDREGEPEIAVMGTTNVGEGPEFDADEPLVGSPDAIAQNIREYRDAGATRIVTIFYTHDVLTSIDQQVAQIETFGEEVIPRFRD